ncbi:MAG: glutathione S-transferase family protein [Halioglobus sp.]
MDSNEAAGLVAAVNAELTDPNRNHLIGASEGEPVRFELYHAGLSVCSQKVRAALAEKRVAYASHELSILNSKGIYSDEMTPAENYSPNYVRLRLLGGKQAGLSFASGYTGTSSVETEGFDACVVPTLVDLDKGRVIVDSKKICEYLDQEITGPIQLLPDEPSLRKAVMEQVSIVDTTPQPALLYGYHPDDDQRPAFIKEKMVDVYDLKLEALEGLIRANKDDAEVVAAYQSKISKEQGGKGFAHDDEAQRAVRALAQEIINGLDEQLAAHASPWVCGSTFTMADLTWAINLYRMQWLGVGSLWKDLPRVQEYAALLYKRPSIWNAVIKFPSPMPESPHTMDLETPEFAA